MNLEIKEIINNLKLANKNNLDKIYLQIEDDEKTEIINLDKKSLINRPKNLFIPYRLKFTQFFSSLILMCK